jgi:bifunctional polynucleotide phosphatase/kinase
MQDPFEYLHNRLLMKTAAPVLFSRRNDVDLVLFCGSPAAGKSTFYWKYLQPLGYERVNQDILKSVRLGFSSSRCCYSMCPTG